MEAAMKKMESQLELWGLKISEVAARTYRVGVPARHETLMGVDELKALHAIAQEKFDAFKAAKDQQRARLEAGLKIAWRELEAAFGSPGTSP